MHVVPSGALHPTLVRDNRLAFGLDAVVLKPASIYANKTRLCCITQGSEEENGRFLASPSAFRKKGFRCARNWLARRAMGEGRL